MPTRQERLLEIALEAIAKLKARVDASSLLAKGDKGDTGEPGKDGRDGKDGKDGRDGTNGKNGLDGVDGLDGLDGRNGKDGKNGVDGKDGRDGLDGTNGSDGLHGRDGIDGKDGVGVDRVEQPRPDVARFVLTDGSGYDIVLPKGKDYKGNRTIVVGSGSGSNPDTPVQSAGGFVPTLIKANQTFTIPEDNQALFMKRIKLENGARLKAFGILVQPR